MKKRIISLLILGAVVTLSLSVKSIFNDTTVLNKIEKKVTVETKNHEIRNGDIIFQSSSSGQSKAIQLATKSPYTHCGIIFIQNGKEFVLEAVQPVKYTPLEKWIAQGENNHYVIKRLKNASSILSNEVVQKMKNEGTDFLGKNYDLTFEWSDDRIYCSELVWKIYQRATGIEVGKLEQLKDFDLSHAIVKKIMKERYGDNIPLNETVISPVSIFNSDELIELKRN